MTSITLVIATLALGGGHQDLSTPQKTVQGFFTAINKANFAEASRFVKGGKTSKLLDEVQNNFKEGKMQVNVTMGSVAIDGDKAKADYQLTSTSFKEVIKESFDLVRLDSKWLINPPEKASATSFGGSMAALMANPEVLAEVFASAKKAAMRTACLSNMKQVCLATIMFASDNEDVLKGLNNKNFKTKVSPYVKHDGIWRCPAEKTDEHPYSFNEKLAGVNMMDIAEPTQTVFYYEGKNGKLNFRHDGKAAVAYADGHVRSLTPEEAKKLRWTP